MNKLTIDPKKDYTVKELFDTGLRVIDEIKDPCHHEKAAIATVRVAVAEFRKYIDENQIVKGDLNDYLKMAFGGMGTYLESFMVLVEQAAGADNAKCQDAIH